MSRKKKSRELFGVRGGREGFELKGLNPDGIRNILQNIVRIGSSKESINKGLSINNHIKSVIYSKDEIEIKLYESNDFSIPINRNEPSSDGILTKKSKADCGYNGAQRPKMPPPTVFSEREKFATKKKLRGSFPREPSQ